LCRPWLATALAGRRAPEPPPAIDSACRESSAGTNATRLSAATRFVPWSVIKALGLNAMHRAPRARAGRRPHPPRTPRGTPRDSPARPQRLKCRHAPRRGPWGATDLRQPREVPLSRRHVRRHRAPPQRTPSAPAGARRRGGSGAGRVSTSVSRRWLRGRVATLRSAETRQMDDSGASSPPNSRPPPPGAPAAKAESCSQRIIVKRGGEASSTHRRCIVLLRGATAARRDEQAN